MTATPWGLRSGVESQEGAAADVALAITCDAGMPADVRVEMNQRVGKKIANGSSSIEFLCTGKPQTKTVTVLASGAPFKTGVAFVSGNLSVCIPGRAPGLSSAGSSSRRLPTRDHREFCLGPCRGGDRADAAPARS